MDIREYSKSLETIATQLDRLNWMMDGKTISATFIEDGIWLLSIVDDHDNTLWDNEYHDLSAMYSDLMLLKIGASMMIKREE